MSEKVVSNIPAIYGDMVAAQLELAKIGIAKTRQNTAQGYQFRGVDEILNTASPVLAKHGILTLAKYFDYDEKDRLTGKGGTLIQQKVRGEFTFTSVKDGSQVEVVTLGVAMDSGDKAMSKAQTMALKTALLQTFLIPTQGDDDADADTPEESVAKPDGFEAWFSKVLGVVDQGFEPLKTAWKESKEEFRTFAMAHREAQWADAKKRALAVTNAAKPKKVAKP